MTVLILLAAGLVSAQPAAQAQKCYESGDYACAARHYEKLVAEDPREPAWHYNLGNARFKAGRLGLAVASYQRAFDLAPRDGDAAFNLDFALRRAGEDLVPAGVPPLLYRLFHALSDAELAGLHWLGCWLALMLGAARLLVDQRRASLTAPAGAALALWLIAGAWWGSRRWLEPSARAVVIKPVAELRSGPGDGFPVGFTVPEGRRVEILSGDDAWLEVGVAKEGAKGWVRADALERL